MRQAAYAYADIYIYVSLSPSFSRQYQALEEVEEEVEEMAAAGYDDFT